MRYLEQVAVAVDTRSDQTLSQFLAADKEWADYDKNIVV